VERDFKNEKELDGKDEKDGRMERRIYKN